MTRFTRFAMAMRCWWKTFIQSSSIQSNPKRKRKYSRQRIFVHSTNRYWRAWRARGLFSAVFRSESCVLFGVFVGKNFVGVLWFHCRLKKISFLRNHNSRAFPLVALLARSPRWSTAQCSAVQSNGAAMLCRRCSQWRQTAADGRQSEQTSRRASRRKERRVTGIT